MSGRIRKAEVVSRIAKRVAADYEEESDNEAMSIALEIYQMMLLNVTGDFFHEDAVAEYSIFSDPSSLGHDSLKVVLKDGVADPEKAADAIESKIANAGKRNCAVMTSFKAAAGKAYADAMESEAEDVEELKFAIMVEEGENDDAKLDALVPKYILEQTNGPNMNVGDIVFYRGAYDAEPFRKVVGGFNLDHWMRHALKDGV